MLLVTKSRIDEYLYNDITEKRLNTLSLPSDESLTCQRWLRESAPKRFIYDKLYADVLSCNERRRILDIGGGLTAFSRELASRHDYYLIDLLVHDDPTIANVIANETNRHFLHVADWYDVDTGDFELVIANDVFPNVDQRLEIFLERYLPKCNKLRLSLTWYDPPRFYPVKRIDCEEIFFITAWDQQRLESALRRFSNSIIDYNTNFFSNKQPSSFANGRHVCIVEFSGLL